ncbi:hypothetical protein M404DRAFT_129518, partial [Pisolithus tinctorius Marx 270]
QWWQWLEIIPVLIKRYLWYLEVSQSLCIVVEPQVATPSQCTCAVHQLSVCSLCLHVSGLEEIKISYCTCTPAPVQLIGCGLFVCSLITPTLAVDLCVLEFVKTLFVQLTPNTTAWCEALESFLDAQGYKMQQFTNAYHWYTVLRIYSDEHIAALVHSFPSASEKQGSSRASDYLCACCPLCFGGDLQRTGAAQDE